MLYPILQRTAGIDVHKKVIVVTLALTNGVVNEVTRTFGTFLHDYEQLAQWLVQSEIQLTVMESTGVYWQHLDEVLETYKVKMYVVNARHVKKVPGRTTDVSDSQWLAALARFGLLKASFIPEQDLRQLRSIARYRTKLSTTLAGEKNRLHKLLDAAGVRLGSVVSDIDGVAANKIINGILNGEPLAQLLSYAKGKLKHKVAAMQDALAVKMNERSLLLLRKIRDHIDYLKHALEQLDAYILTAMQP